LVPKLVLIHVLSGNIHLGGIGNGRENFVSIIFILSKIGKKKVGKVFLLTILEARYSFFFFATKLQIKVMKKKPEKSSVFPRTLYKKLFQKTFPMIFKHFL
jgi:hypothetical protein